MMLKCKILYKRHFIPTATLLAIACYYCNVTLESQERNKIVGLRIP